jgi:hypothetical protein
MYSEITGNASGFSGGPETWVAVGSMGPIVPELALVKQSGPWVTSDTSGSLTPMGPDTGRSAHLANSRPWICYHSWREVTMIHLTDEQTSLLKQGYTVRVRVPEPVGDVVVILAGQRESTESVLQEACARPS